MSDDFDPVGFVVGNIIAGAGIALSVLSAGTLSSIGLAIASYGIGLMGRSIGGRPSRVQAQQANYDPTATNKVCYGGPLWIGITGADIWVDHDDVSDHQSLWTFGVFSIGSENGQGIEAVEKIKIDGIMAIDPVTTGGQVNLETGRTSYYDEADLLSYNIRLGTDTQGVNTDAQSAASNASDRYPNSFRFRGLCYGAFNMWKHKDKFPNFPRSISALVKGVRVYDPRNPTDGPDGDGFIWDKADTSASLNQHPGRNPALILLDYLTSKRYGDAAFYPERDGGDLALSEIDEQSFIDAANHCDELIQDGEGGTQPRYSFTDWLDTGNSLEQNTAAILSSMRGILHYQQGRYRLVIPQVQSSVMTLSEDDIIGDWTVRRAGANQVPNRVVAQIPAREGETTTEVQFPDEDDTTFLDQDNGVPQVRTVQLYGVDDPVRAEQIAMISLRESREDAGVSFRATERAAELEVGDVFTLDHAFPGWQDAGAKEFRVLDLTHRPDFTVEVTATEYADSAYSLSSQTRPTPPPGSDLPDATTTGAPSNLQLTSNNTTQQVTPAGDKVPGILATWTLPTDKGIDRVVVLEREDGTSSWNTADVVDPTEEQRSLFRPQGGAEGETWEVGVYVLVGQRLLKSTTTTATVPLDTDFQPTDLPDGPAVDATLVSGSIVLEVWELLADPHPSGSGNYQIRSRTRVLGETWGSWGAWQAVGTSTGSGLTVEVARHPTLPTTLQYEARDTGRNDHTGPRGTETIKSIHDLLDIPSTGRGRDEERRGRDGFGGEMPGGGRSSAPVYNPGRDTRRLEPIGGALENTRLLSTAFLSAGVKQTDGARTGYVQKGHDGDTAKHGDGVNFPGGSYQAIPQIDLLHGWMTYSSGLTGDQIPLPRAKNATSSGFTLDARVWEVVSGTSEQQIAFSEATIAAVGIDDRDYAANMEDASDPSAAWDDRYTVNLDLSATGQSSLECDGQEIGSCQQTCDGGSIVVGIYSNDGTGYMLRGTVDQTADCNLTASNVDVVLYVSGLSTHGGPEWATGVESESGLGGSYTANTVTWETVTTTPDSKDATQHGNAVAWTSRVKEDG